MSDETTDESNDKGKETDTPVEENKTDTPIPPQNTSLEEAKEINKKKEELLEREEKLMKRKEDLVATQMVGGHTVAGQEQKPLTPEEKIKEEADARVQRIGEAVGAEWAKKKE